jgi:putative holliday junction resolvase
MNYLSIDYWTKKCWLAINVWNIAIPLKIIATKVILDEIKKIIEEKKIDTIVIWMANYDDWKESVHSKRIKSFSWILKKSILKNIEIVFYDEWYSTFEAKNNLEEVWIKQKNVDDIAACIILQNYLDL